MPTKSFSIARLLFISYGGSFLIDAEERAPLFPRALRTARPSAFRRSRVPTTHGKGRRRTSLRLETASTLAPRTIVEMPAACVAPAAALGAAAASRRQGSPLRARAAAKQGAISPATTPRHQARERAKTRAADDARPRAWRRTRRADPRRSRRHPFRDWPAFLVARRAHLFTANRPLTRCPLVPPSAPTSAQFPAARPRRRAPPPPRPRPPRTSTGTTSGLV